MVFTTCCPTTVQEIEVKWSLGSCCDGGLPNGVFTRSSKRPANFQQMYSKYTC